MDKLAPKLIRRASKKNYIGIVIDPIYKVITGDENSADQMANFCNQFDKVCTELGVAVIYCHHHSKGNQGGKRSMDRASGSGVFARDPDALIDLIELDVNDDLRLQQANKKACDVCGQWIDKFNLQNEVSQDDLCSAKEMQDTCKRLLDAQSYQTLTAEIAMAHKAVENASAWRIAGTLREFPKFTAINLWFDYPTHKIDDVGVLKDIQLDNDAHSWKKSFNKKKTPEDRKKEKEEALEMAFETCTIDENVTIKSLAEYMGVAEKTIRNRIKEHGGFWIDDSIVGKK